MLADVNVNASGSSYRVRIIQKILITSKVVVAPLEVGLRDMYSFQIKLLVILLHSVGNTRVYQTSCPNIFRSNPHPKGSLHGVFC